MDPNANLKAQAELLHMRQHSLIQTRAQRAHRRIRLQELREALHTWLANHGTPPEWTSYPVARAAYYRWATRRTVQRFGQRVGRPARREREGSSADCRPCYVIDDGARGGSSVSYEDGWCYGPSRHLGTAVEEEDIRALIKADIRQKFEERNGLPLFRISDHGNECRLRTIRLRTKELKR